MSKLYWDNLAALFNHNMVDPTRHETLIPPSLHDESWGVEYHYHPESDSFGWDVVNWKTSNL